MSVILAGTGCGNRGTMTAEVLDAMREADCLIGAKRLLESIPAEYTANRKAAVYASEICSMIQAQLAEAEQSGREAHICVLYSGDSGFYSGTRSLLPLLEEAGIEAKVCPGISSIQVLSARLGIPWQDWLLVSAHGTDCDAVTSVMQGRQVFFLTGGKLGPRELCAQLTEAGLGALPVTVAERLSYEDETIIQGTAAEFSQRDFHVLSVMLAEPADCAGDLSPGIDDSEFIRGEVPMTKQDIRAAILGHLQIRKTDTVWDVGAGTGSVSIEMAMKASRGRVYAVEKVPEGCSLIRQNREKFGVWNLQVREGAAPEALVDLPAPDKVFIGGSNGQLKQITQIALDKNPNARICVSAIVLETLQEATEAMTSAGLDVGIVQVQVNTARKLGKKHMMMAGNPIYIVTGQRQEAADA